MKRKLKRSNYTLIELLVTTSIIGILLFSLLIAIGCVIVGIWCWNNVEEKGIKGVSEEIYYGKDKAPTETK